MAYDGEWSEDFCLYCDAQISRGAYCSDTCRSADRRSSTASSGQQYKPTRTVSTAGSSASSWTTTAQARNAASYSLPSGFTFPPPRGVAQSFSSAGSSRQPSPGETQDALKRFSIASVESPSSTDFPSRLSRSLGGFNGSPTTGLSEHAVRELKQYESSFDQTRNHRMRAYGSR